MDKLVFVSYIYIEMISYIQYLLVNHVNETHEHGSEYLGLGINFSFLRATDEWRNSLEDLNG